MKTRIFFSCLLATLLVCAVCEAQAQVFRVDCNSGQTITQALHAHPGIVPITIVANGQCNENVLIDRDDVTLGTVSLPPFITPGTVNGTDSTKATITVAAARAVIDGLTVTGGRRGITVLGSATIKNCTVQNTGPIGVISSGISFYHGGQGTVDNCTVKNNRSFGIAIEGGSATVTKCTISANTDAGIVVSLGGSARIGLTDDMVYAAKNKIQNNGSNGIMINAGGSAFIGGNTIDGNGTTAGHRFGQFGIAIYQATAILVGANTIINNRGSGVFARGSAVLIGDPTFGLDSANKINDNGVGVGVSTKGGIFGFLGSSLEIQNATIDHNTGNGVTLSTRSTARMFENNKITRNDNGILLEAGGGLLLPTSTTTITTNTLFGLQCTDAESSFAGNTSGISGNTGGQVSPSCTGF